MRKVREKKPNAKVDEVKPGDFLVPDDSFRCMREGVAREVRLNYRGKLFVKCSDGSHLLERQEKNGVYLGLSLLEK